MKLLKAKVAGHHVVLNSGWFPIDKTLTIVAGVDGAGKSTILKGLLTLNPIPAQQKFNTFVDYPKYFHTNVYRKKIDTGKKTAALGVFTCSDTLLNQLVTIDPVLYGTDRVEVGRRLDLSRWITFVEIATSTRWSEIAKDTFALQEFVVTQTTSQKLLEQFEQCTLLKNTNRINGEIATNLGSWLNNIEKFINAIHRTLFDRVRFGVYRADRFIKARQAVADHLPYFLYFSGSHLLKPEIDLSKRNKIDKSFVHSLDLESKASPNSKKIKTCESRVNTLLKKYWPAVPTQISFEVDGNMLILSVKNSGNNTIPFNKAAPVFLLQVSLTIALLANIDKSPGNLILLLDEPDSNMGEKIGRA